MPNNPDGIDEKYGAAETGKTGFVDSGNFKRVSGGELPRGLKIQLVFAILAIIVICVLVAFQMGIL